MKRWIQRIVMTLVALLVITAGGAWLLLGGSLARLDGTLRVSGITAPVTITRDRLGVATIDADNRLDLAYGLGFEHAQERFFEMDLQRRMAAGELAALLGPAALKLDLNHRRHRFRERDRALIDQVPQHQRDVLRAYRDGVNAGLKALEVRPWEYLLLGSAPKPWRMEDTLLTVDAMSLELNDDGTDTRELDIERLRAALPAPVVKLLMSPSPTWEAPLQGAPSPAPDLPEASVFTLRTSMPASATTTLLHDADAPGSNQFAVSGSLSGPGAIVANDMHLGLSVPNIWFRARLRYPDDIGNPVDLNGITLPGTPLLIAGSNGHIAWGFTNSYGDWQDWVRIRRDPKHTDRYRTPDGWATIKDHVEIIKVKGGPDRKLIVRDTLWGPIMARDIDGTPLALHWVAHLPRSHNLNLMQLEQTDSVHQALMVAPTIGMPPQNFIVGDSEGHIGWTLTGNALPLRDGFDPLVPSDWSRRGTGWIGFASPLQFPRIENPADGRLWTANNRTTGGEWESLIGNGGYWRGARAKQIRDDLFARNRFTTENMLAIQLDDRAVFLARWQKLLQDVLARHPEAHLDALQDLTRHWQGRAAIDSVDYRLVRAFRTRVVTAVLHPFAARVRKRFPHFRLPRHSEAAVWAMLQQKPDNLLSPRYANWDELLIDAARAVNQDLGSKPGGLAARTWGERNTA
ncbi:penicillin acylase family protein, partial [Oleiagrimonas sp.]|uniref:penicillin acylase family protein n=1 Tax=Oleiagrimonas sp. TaxID=2010330 RepID=UPI00262B6184